MLPPKFPITSLITQNHHIRGTASCFSSDISNLSFQSCPTVALTSLLSFSHLLPLLFSPYVSSRESQYHSTLSLLLQTFPPRIHLSHHLLITLISPFPCTDCKNTLRALAFPSFVAGCATTSISYMLLSSLGCILLLEQVLWSSHTFVHTVPLCWNSLSSSTCSKVLPIFQGPGQILSHSSSLPWSPSNLIWLLPMISLDTILYFL